MENRYENILNHLEKSKKMLLLDAEYYNKTEKEMSPESKKYWMDCIIFWADSIKYWASCLEKLEKEGNAA
jgi:hypothetical protein